MGDTGMFIIMHIKFVCAKLEVTGPLDISFLLASTDSCHKYRLLESLYTHLRGECTQTELDHVLLCVISKL